MKLTFEGKTFGEVLDQMQDVLTGFSGPKIISQPVSETPVSRARPLDELLAEPQGPGPAEQIEAKPPGVPPVDSHVANPVDKPKRERTEKQKANDERLRAAAAAKASVRTGQREAAKLAKEEPTVPMAAEKPKAKAVEETDPAKVVAIRQKTIEDLQSAYANGHQAEVFELLSKFGNGAKSFRELPPEAFMPIREAIDAGALT